MTPGGGGGTPRMNEFGWFANQRPNEGISCD